MNKTAVIAIVALLVLGGGFLLLTQKVPSENTQVQDTTETSELTVDMNSPSLQVAGSESESSPAAGATNEASNTFTIDATNFKFSVTEMKVKKGDTVTVKLNVNEGFHDWVVDEFDAKTKQMGEGNSDEITFVADKTGTFEYYCSVGQHRKAGMVGTLIVE